MSAVPTVGERLAAALLPALLHRVQNTTQLIVGVRALAALEPLSLPQRSSGDLAAAARAAHEQGWLLGVLSRALGADLLLAREERDGLRPVLELVRDGLRREGRDLTFAVGEMPRLGTAIDGPDTAARCAALAALAWAAGTACERGTGPALLFARGAAGHELRADLGAGEALRSTFEELGLGRQACVLRAESAAWALHVPAAWFSFPA